VRIEALFAKDGGMTRASSGRDGSSVTGEYEPASGEVIFSEAGKSRNGKLPDALRHHAAGYCFLRPRRSRR
jgi:hypothetical protein